MQSMFKYGDSNVHADNGTTFPFSCIAPICSFWSFLDWKRRMSMSSRESKFGSFVVCVASFRNVIFGLLGCLQTFLFRFDFVLK